MHIVFTLNRVVCLLCFIAILTVVGCLQGPDTADIVTPDSEAEIVPQRAAAPVEAISIVQEDSFPVRVTVVVRGHFPNACGAVDQIRQERRGGTFLIAVDGVSYAGESCPANRTAFEEVITLDVIGLPAGIYVVDVNGLQGTFKLQRDNIRDDGNAVVGGLVWLDRCELLDEGDSQAIEATAGCVEVDSGRYGGDGVQSDDESGIGGVKVHLGAGICPSSGLATTLTAPDGTFLFSGLVAGDYCLTLIGDEESDDPLAEAGLWTYPTGFSGQQNISLQPSESILDLAFGWTAVQSPSEPVFFATVPSSCSNKALFVADVTIADDTPLIPGELFTKTWQLQNLGSCTWDPSYNLVFAGGEQMSGPDSVPLKVTVPPGEFADLSVRLMAPERPGVYRGEWKLAEADGATFGVGPGSDRAFWVQIAVVEEADGD